MSRNCTEFLKSKNRFVVWTYLRNYSRLGLRYRDQKLVSMVSCVRFVRRAAVLSAPSARLLGKTGQPRVVWLSPALLELTKEMVQKGPGFLFRNNVGGQ